MQPDPQTDRFQRLGIVALAILLFGFGVTTPSALHGQQISTTLYNALFSGAGLVLLGLAVKRSLGPRVTFYAFSFVIFALLLDAASTLITTPPYSSDNAAAPVYAAELLLQGLNPYEALRVSDAVARFGLSQDYVTVLMDGTPWDAYVYPAGSFLTLVPFVALGIPDLRVIYISALLITFFVIYFRSPVQFRLIVLVVFIIYYIFNHYLFFIGLPEPLIGLLLVCSWYGRNRIGPASMCLGIAASMKQLSWFFIPFYVIYVWRRRGWRPASASLALIVAIFFVTNGPFLLATPEEWISGVLALSLIPLPSMGIGLSPFGSNLAPGIPHSAYTFVSLVVYAALVLWYAVQRKPNAAFAWIIPLFPLWFAWRSLSHYFFLIPLLGLAIASDSWPDTGESTRGPHHHKGEQKGCPATEMPREQVKSI